MGKYAEDEQLLLRLKNKDQLLLKKLYYEWSRAFQLFIIRRYQCSADDALEVYPETVARFYQNITDGRLTTPLQSSLKTYLFGIGKNLFHKRFFDKFSERTVLEEEFPDAGERASVLDTYDYDAQRAQVQALLDRVGEPCKQLLTLIYVKDYSNEAIAREMEIPTEGAVRKRKFDCLKKMRTLMES